MEPCPPSTAPNRTSPAQGSVWSCPDIGAFVSAANRREIRRGPNPAGLTQAGPGRGMTEDSDAAACGYYSPSHHAYAQIPGGRGQPAPFPFTPGSHRERVSFRGLLVPTPFGFLCKIQLEFQVDLPRWSTKIATPVGVVAGEPRSGLRRFYSPHSAGFMHAWGWASVAASSLQPLCHNPGLLLPPRAAGGAPPSLVGPLVIVPIIIRVRSARLPAQLLPAGIFCSLDRASRSGRALLLPPPPLPACM